MWCLLRISIVASTSNGVGLSAQEQSTINKFFGRVRMMSDTRMHCWIDRPRVARQMSCRCWLLAEFKVLQRQEFVKDGPISSITLQRVIQKKAWWTRAVVFSLRLESSLRFTLSFRLVVRASQVVIELHQLLFFHVLGTFLAECRLHFDVIALVLRCVPAGLRQCEKEFFHAKHFLRSGRSDTIDLPCKEVQNHICHSLLAGVFQPAESAMDVLIPIPFGACLLLNCIESVAAWRSL